MKGQWIGKVTGSKDEVIINIDDLGDRYGGVAYLMPLDTEHLGSASFFKTEDKSKNFKFKADINVLNPYTGEQYDWEDIKDQFPGKSFPSEADVIGSFKENELKLKATPNIGTEIEINITRSPFTDTSDIEGTTMDWNEYKEHASTLLEKKLFYRGQEKPYKLRTAYHRKGRYNVSRFIDTDIPMLYRHLSARTSHVFNLDLPDENGAFLNLAQHHGYPTPLLDWTYSPYVAAFFAFRNISKDEESEDPVRIWIFDHQEWKKSWNQLMRLDVPGLHLSVMEFLAIENARLIPQQAVTTMTNIDDIEAYLLEKETIIQKDKSDKTFKYLRAIDISKSERNKVMKELAFMGITAASMFPGLDGVCESLREELFDV